MADPVYCVPSSMRCAKRAILRLRPIQIGDPRVKRPGRASTIYVSMAFSIEFYANETEARRIARWMTTVGQPFVTYKGIILTLFRRCEQDVQHEESSTEFPTAVSTLSPFGQGNETVEK